jgi:F1F0 ATPase subunit 2
LAVDERRMTGLVTIDVHAGGLAAILRAAATGLVCGVIHFYALWWNVRFLTARRSLTQAVGLQIGRLCTIGAAMAFFAPVGAGSVIAGMLGFLAARMAIFRLVGGQS